MKTPTYHAWVAVAASLWAGAAMAGTGVAFLNVNITLNEPTMSAPTICISETLSKQANAIVRVICATDQFVSISPMPGKPFLGAHGGAFRYISGLGKKSDSLADIPDNLSAGTTTELPIYSTNSTDSPLEVLVSY